MTTKAELTLGFNGNEAKKGIAEVDKAEKDLAKTTRDVGDAGAEAGQKVKAGLDKAAESADDLREKVESADNAVDGGGGGNTILWAGAAGVAFQVVIAAVDSLIGRLRELAAEGSVSAREVTNEIDDVGAAISGVKDVLIEAGSEVIPGFLGLFGILIDSLKGDMGELREEMEALAEAEKRAAAERQVYARVNAVMNAERLAAEFAHLKSIREVDAAIKERQASVAGASQDRLDAISDELDALLRLRGEIKQADANRERAAQKEAERQAAEEKKAQEREKKEQEREKKEQERHAAHMQRERDKERMAAAREAEQKRRDAEAAAKAKQQQIAQMGQQFAQHPAAAALLSGANISDRDLSKAVGEQRAREAGAKFDSDDANVGKFDNDAQRQAARDKAMQDARRAGFMQAQGGHATPDEIEQARRGIVDQRIGDAQSSGRLSQEQADAFRDAAKSMRDAADSQQQINNIVDAATKPGKQDRGPSFAERAGQRREAAQQAGEGAEVQQATGQVVGSVSALGGALSGNNAAAIAAFDALSKRVDQMSQDIVRHDQLWSNRTQATDSKRRTDRARRVTN